MYAPGSPYDLQVQTVQSRGNIVVGIGEATIDGPNPDPFTGQLATDEPQARNLDLTCGQPCSGPASSCSGNDGCKCLAEMWQGPGSGDYTGVCKIPYFLPGSRRRLSGIFPESAALANSTIFVQSTGLGNMTDVACPCNCTYVSIACCNSASGIMYESPQLKLGVLQRPNSTMSCNNDTGQFETMDGSQI